MAGLPSSFTYVHSPVVYIAFFLSIFSSYVISPYFSKKWIPAYSSIKPKSRPHWNTMLSSTTHALVNTILPLIVIFGADTEDYVTYKTRTGFLSLQIALGYFLGDAVVVLMSEELRSEKGSVLHHIGSIVGMFLGLYYEGVMMFFLCFRLVAEMSTPFVNMRWILYEVDVKRSSEWYLVASVGMTVSFFMSRILAAPIFWYKILMVLSDESAQIIPLHLQIWLVLNSALFDFLNVYWFAKIAKGAIKLFRQMRWQEAH